MTAPPGNMSCRELVELVTDYLEDRLPAEDRARFERHLEMCEACVDYLDQMLVTMRAVGTLREEHLEPTMRDELLEAFRDWNASRSP